MNYIKDALSNRFMSSVKRHYRQCFSYFEKQSDKSSIVLIVVQMKTSTDQNVAEAITKRRI